MPAKTPKAATSRPASKKTVEAYLAAAPKDKRPTLEMFRRTIRAGAPTAEEYFAYGGLVGYRYRGKPLIYFGYAKEHCALYGGWVAEFAGDLEKFRGSKGTLRSTPELPITATILRKIVKARRAAVDAALEKAR